MYGRAEIRTRINDFGDRCTSLLYDAPIEYKRRDRDLNPERSVESIHFWIEAKRRFCCCGFLFFKPNLQLLAVA